MTPPADATTVCFPFVGDAVGGSHISAAGLITALAGGPFRPLVPLHDMAGPLAPWLAEQNIATVAAPAVPLVAPGPRCGLALVRDAATVARRSLPALVRFLRANRVGIVHTNDGRIHASWGAAAWLAGARLVFHHRGDPDALAANVVAPLLADRVVTVSRFARPGRPLLPLERRLSVVHSPFDRPPPCDVPAALAALAAELGLPAGVRFAGSFGFLIERKRPVAFVEIIARVRDLHPELALHGLVFGVAAPGEVAVERAVRERIDALEVADRVHLMGFRRPVEPLMAAMDALVVPAVNEPFGRTLIEAMMLGVPVVAARSGGNIEAIEDGRTGVLVAPDDIAGFAAALAGLLTDPARAAAIAATAKAEALARYSTAHHVAAILDIYRDLVRHPKSSPSLDASSSIRTLQ